jgi:Histone methylation protein DOT1
MMAKASRRLGGSFGLRDLLADLEGDPTLRQLSRFRERIDALNRLDAYDLDSSRPPVGFGDEEGALLHRAIRLRAKLDILNAQVVENIRDAIRLGDGRKAMLRRATKPRHEPVVRPREGTLDADAYDYLDELVSGVLQFEPPDPITAELSSDMVAYQPTPARHIFALIRNTKFTEQDVFIDLGSGLGHVPLLVAICTASRAVGIELEPAYVACAQRVIEELELTNVTFLAQDAREADLSNGTLFYLYTPFRGAILRAVLDRLRLEAARREIRVCTFGPCTPIVAAEPWLVLNPAESGHVSVFRSRL